MTRTNLMKKMDFWILLAIILGACLLTFPGFVAQTSTSSPWVIDNVLNHLRETTLDSKVFYYPMLQANFLAAAIIAYLGAGLLAGAWSWPQVYAELIDPFRFMPVAEVLSLCFGIGAIISVYFLGRRISGRGVGIWAAAILAFTPTFNRYCHEGVPDAALVLFSALAILFLIASLQEPIQGHYFLAGAFLGLAVAAKYNAAVLVPIAILIHLWLWHERKAPLRLLVTPRLGWPIAAGVLAFGLTSFQVLLQSSNFLHHVLVYERDYKMLAYSGAVTPEIFLPWISHLQVMYKLEHGIALLFLLGITVFARRPDRVRVFLFLAVVLSFIYIGRWRMVHPRFYLFIYPALAVLAADAVERTARWIASSGIWAAHLWKGLPRIAAAGLILWTITLYGQHSWSKLLPDTRELSRQWIEEHIPSGALIAGPVTPESYPPLLSRDKIEGYLTTGDIPGKYRSEVKRLLDDRTSYRLRSLYFRSEDSLFPKTWPSEILQRYKESIYAQRAARNDASLNRLKEEGIEYIVTSGYWSGYYLRHAGAEDLPPFDPRVVHFENIRSFYLELESIPEGGEKDGIRHLATFEEIGKKRIGPTIKIYKVVSDSGHDG